MSWKDLYTDARIKYGKAPFVKDDYYIVMSEAVKSSLNADSKLKEALLTFLKPYAFSEYKAASTYKWASIIPPTFIQWLSVQRKKKITFSDIEAPNITPDDAVFFAEQYSESPFVQAQIRSYLIKFGKFLVSRYHITRYPFGDMKVDMPLSRRTIIYNGEMLDDFYNSLLFDSPGYITLFFRMLIQTGQRPGHIYYLTCGDIEYDKPQQDALGQTFYPIFIRKMLEREKRKIKETVFKKVPPEVVYISEQLKNDIVKWCEENDLTSKGYIFKDFITLDAYDTFIRRRRERPDIYSRLKHKEVKYILYGTRHTWTSVMYSITKDIGDLIDLGGWTGANIPLTVYRVSMKSCEALEIAKKWGIYLPPDKMDEISELQARCERKEVEPAAGATTVSIEQFDELKSLVEKLEKQLSARK